jgi:DNA-binding NarL/FixJ family response regulator
VPDLARYASGQPLLVVLIDRPDDAVVLAMLRAGASGMLVRGEFTRSDLLAAITGARHGEVHLSPSVATMVVHALRTLRPPAETSSHAVLSTLSATETRLLDLLATGASNGSISEQLRVAPQTVRNRVSTLYARLGVRSRAEAIALRLG